MRVCSCSYSTSGTTTLICATKPSGLKRPGRSPASGPSFRKWSPLTPRKCRFWHQPRRRAGRRKRPTNQPIRAGRRARFSFGPSRRLRSQRPRSPIRAGGLPFPCTKRRGSPFASGSQGGHFQGFGGGLLAVAVAEPSWSPLRPFLAHFRAIPRRRRC